MDNVEQLPVPEVASASVVSFSEVLGSSSAGSFLAPGPVS